MNKHNRSVDPLRLKDEDRYYFVEAQWPAIIPIELFNDVQDLLAENKKKARKYTHTFQLTGLVKCGICAARLVGKSGHGRNGKHYYYGHFRKRTTFDNRHLERCSNENVNAVELEEAVIASLRELAKDRKLVAKLIATSHENGHRQLAHKLELINSKEQDRRKNEQEINNLVAAIAEGKEAITRQVLSAFETLRIFREEFDSLPPGEQASQLKNIVHGIVIKPDETVVEVFGSGPESSFVLKGSKTLGNSACTERTGFALAVSGCTGIAPSRSAVRTGSRLVDRMGIEPTTLRLPA
ncbi:MAG: recombinase zinc beta ribbon domain-containing protein [Deltaproteobacteria bacterium]|nr:recombinase zinc beta ribbon domain-containing protein [Deltaproteobacteria bacterium]